ncbi:DUF4058 family protein [Limnoglobus roseus]|uniref:DUF4058 domain-containing protein n=1 Tax=Limnoglobus roseus TaxID=2598579 RepID=A0A5C1AJN5_9BACT|nr:DUF4058 family protein [Limnoglobus roseus]QEL17912.1 hypothetical protein PX52LOC_04924 [Limnoglobus roseus]
MPLLDHFHPPLAGRRHWESFHAQWASAIASALNQSLPEDYFAEAQVHAWPRIEVDVATFGESAAVGGGVATLPQVVPQLTAADLTMPATFPPEFGVNVYETGSGPTLVAAVELVSPGNKDRDETRRAFAAKCATYIQRAIGLIVVDIVTSRNSRPFDELLALVYPGQALPHTNPLTAVSYRPVRVNGADSLELRIRSLVVGEALPELLLALGGLGHVMVNLEATYEDARERSRL